MLKFSVSFLRYSTFSFFQFCFCNCSLKYFYDAALKSVSDNFNISYLNIGIYWLLFFPLSLRSYCFLVWWIFFYWNLNNFGIMLRNSRFYLNILFYLDSSDTTPNREGECTVSLLPGGNWNSKSLVGHHWHPTGVGELFSTSWKRWGFWLLTRLPLISPW